LNTSKLKRHARVKSAAARARVIRSVALAVIVWRACF
jgi:hypothetical protein